MAEDLTANGEREVFFEMNGQLRSVFIKDKEAVKVCSNPRLWLVFLLQNTSFLIMLLPFKRVTGWESGFLPLPTSSWSNIHKFMLV
jgi:hypothetical protein